MFVRLKAWVESLVEWEKELFLTLNGSNSHYLDSVMYFISDKWPWIVFMILLLLMTTYRQKRHEAILFILFCALLVTFSDMISSGIIKQLFQRARPTHHIVTRDIVSTVLDYRGGGYGFVSGHATNFLAFVTFSSLVLRNRKYTIIAFIVGLTVAYSRVYLGVHFITDIVGGIILGIIIGSIVYYGYYQSRMVFLDMPKSKALKCYLQPDSRRKDIAILLTATYVAIWLLAPLFIQFYH
ncbi:MAG: phosphatase PAP2 family protein [Porphyromonas sp.]|nr:phosphatase PAP2 family protein [Porphyromonas sp.]